jgi:hypothetical protein
MPTASPSYSGWLNGPQSAFTSSGTRTCPAPSSTLAQVGPDSGCVLRSSRGREQPGGNPRREAPTPSLAIEGDASVPHDSPPQFGYCSSACRTRSSRSPVGERSCTSAAPIVASTLLLAHSPGIEVTAEGVEEEAQAGPSSNPGHPEDWDKTYPGGVHATLGLIDMDTRPAIPGIASTYILTASA